MVKRISLAPLNRASDVLAKLLNRYNDTCRSLNQRSQNLTKPEYFIRIPAKEATTSEAISTCKKLGMKLMELRTNADVSSFLAEVDDQIKHTPASIFYDRRTRAFVFASDNLPLRDNTAIRTTPDGYRVEAYDAWDSYQTYFGRYTIVGAQLFLEFVDAHTRYDHFFCQRLDTKRKSYESTCGGTFQFIEDIVTTHQHYMNQLRGLLQRGYGPGGGHLDEARGKRANPLLMGAVGGIFGALTTELFTRISPDDQVAAAAAQTEEVLDNLGERTNALDVNQKRLHVLIEEVQWRLSRDLGMVAQTANLFNIHIQINSILIHVNDHLGYLYRLLAGEDTDMGINLAISEEERKTVLEKTANFSTEIQVSPGTPVKHRFQFLASGMLCVIMDIPIKPAISSIAAVEVSAFPFVRNGSLWTSFPKHAYFIHFSGGHYVDVEEQAFWTCLREGTCTGMLPLQHADKTAGCHITEYFGETHTPCEHERAGKGRFLMQIGGNLAFALQKPLQIKIDCEDQKKNRIENLIGRGVIDIPTGCLARTNKVVLSKPQHARLIVEHNVTLFKAKQIKPFTTLMKVGEQIHLGLTPTNQRDDIIRKSRGIRWEIVVAAASGGILILLVTSSILFIALLKKACRTQRRPTNL